MAFSCLKGYPVHFLSQGKRNVVGVEEEGEGREGEEKEKLKKKKDECERALNLCQWLLDVNAI